MAIKFDKAYNNFIRNEVRNFNKRRKTLSKHGVKLTVEPLKVSELKARHVTRESLNKELAMLRKAGLGKSSTKLINTPGGATTTKWQIDYLNMFKNEAVKYYENERDIVAAKVGRFPGERLRLEDLEDKLTSLYGEPEFFSDDAFKAYQGAIRRYMSIPGKMKGGYRGFLLEVEIAMKNIGYTRREINAVFDKLKELKPYQFHKLYEENDLINRIYELVPSPKHGRSGQRFTTTDEDAEELISAFLEQLDELVGKYKEY